jgi:hypothetical protein
VLSPTFDGIEDRLQFRVERRSDSACDLYGDCSRSSLDVRVIARANVRLMSGCLLRESKGFASRSNRAAQFAGIHDRMMDEEQNYRPGTMVPIKLDRVRTVAKLGPEGG